MAEEKKEFTVSFVIKENGKSTTVELDVFATNKADAIEVAKKQLAVDREGKNYQVIPGASVTLKYSW